MSPRTAPDARRRLLEAGLRLLDQRGLDGINTNQVARAAGVGVGTYYAHFRDKQDLVRQVVLQGLEHVGERVRESAARPAHDREGRVREQVRAVLEAARERPLLFRVAFGGVGQSLRGGPGPPVRQLERRLRGLQVQGLLDERIDPGSAARGWHAMLSAVVIAWLQEHGPIPAEALVESLVRLHPVVAGAPAGGPVARPPGR